MNQDVSAGAQFPEDVAAFFPQGRLDALRAEGHDFLEAKRDGVYTYDQNGARYIDCAGSAGTFNLGRRRPELIAELNRAMRETDQGNFPMISSIEG